LAGRIKNWSVLQDRETSSDHEWISFEISSSNSRRREATHKAPKGWRISSERIPQFLEKVKATFAQIETVLDAKACEEAVTAACDETFPKKKGGNGRKEVYWWTQEIADIRRECISWRRKVVRGNKNRNATEADRRTWRDTYAIKRRMLCWAINKEKVRSWDTLIQDLNEDVWGLGYKIVTKKLKLNSIPALTTEEQMEVAEKLFPNHEVIEWEAEVVDDEPQPFTEEEVQKACALLKIGKAPGPDNITTELVKALVANCAKEVTTVMNGALKDGIFPAEWKVARLVLLQKPQKAGQPTSYRPLCLLNVMGKLLERLLLARLEAEAPEPSDKQYGFRKGRSTVHAIKKVLEIGKQAARGAYQVRKICCLITLDIKNAFNSAPWRKIAKALKKRNTPPYLIRIIKSYLNNRWVLINDQKVRVTCGVPQGSVLGPYLWNVLYDEVLETDLPEGVQLVAFADDLAILVTEKTREAVEKLANLALEIIIRRIRRIGVEIAPEKTEAVLLNTRRFTPLVRIKVSDTEIETQKSIKYLGVWLETGMKVRVHVQKASEKAEKTSCNLSRLMPNVRGPRSSKRKALANVVLSTVLYAAPAWEEGISSEEVRIKLDATMRKALLRTCSAYRTASTAAVEAIAGIPPVRLLAAERSLLFNTGGDRNEARAQTLDKWQEMWTDPAATKARWTRRLIPDIRTWSNRKHGEVTYHLTQVLTGHGVFGDYFLRFRLDGSDLCWYCGDQDSANHTIFACARWEEARRTTEQSVGAQLTPENIVAVMLQSTNAWNVIAAFITKVMMDKEATERDMGR